MMCYRNMINELADLFIEHKLQYPDTIIIGNNSSGKSELLKTILLKTGFESWYLIDSVNRYFSAGQIFKMNGEMPDVEFSMKIAEHRLKEDNYNLRDTFYYKGVPTPIENFYFEFEEKIKELVRQFLGVELAVLQSKTGYEIYLDNIESMLSSGYQALIRIFMEMEYVSRTMGCGYVIIDEIDEFLFSYNSGKIFQFLRQEYQNFSFIVTTHSADLIANAKAANIVLLSEEAYELLDADDFNSISQVYNIFDSVFVKSRAVGGKEQIDACLRRLLNNKTAGVWRDADQNEFARLKEMNLSKVQKVLIRQIEEW